MIHNKKIESIMPGWWHAWVREQGLSHSGGGVPHGMGGYKTVAPQWHVKSSKPEQMNSKLAQQKQVYKMDFKTTLHLKGWKIN